MRRTAHLDGADVDRLAASPIRLVGGLTCRRRRPTVPQDRHAAPLGTLKAPAEPAAGAGFCWRRRLQGGAKALVGCPVPNLSQARLCGVAQRVVRIAAL